MHSRRAVLQSGAAGVALLAGCAGTDDANGADDEGETVTDGNVPSDVAAWIPDHDAFVTADSEVWFDVMDLAALVETGTFPDADRLREDVEGEYAGALEPEDVSFGLVIGRVSVLGGAVDGGAVVDAFGLDSIGSRGEFELYADDDRLLGVAADHLLRRDLDGGDSETARGELEAVIDAAEGTGDRLADANEDFALLADELDPGAVAFGRVDVDGPDAGGGPVAEGMGADLSATEARIEFVEVYPDEADVDVDAAREAFEASLEEDAGGEVSAVDVSRNGRNVLFEAVTDPETFFEMR